MDNLDNDKSIYKHSRPDDSLFNLRHLQAHTKTMEKPMRELFADDTAVAAHTDPALRHLTSCFAEAAELFELEVSLKKTEVLYQPASCRVPPPQTYPLDRQN